DFETLRASFAQLILPAFTLGVFSLAPIARMTRAAMLAVLASEFVRTARASGLNDRTVILTYAFRNAMLPVVTTLGLVFSVALGALLGPYVVPYDPLASDTAATLQAPSLRHWFGTDLLGRDIFSRVVVATRLDFIIALASVALVFVMGGFAGIAAGYFGGWTD